MGTIELDAFKVAKQLHGNQDYDACELILYEHLKINRVDIEALGLMAENYEKIFRPDLAVNSYRSAVEIAKAKGEDFQTLEESAARVDATLKNIENGGKNVDQYQKENQEKNDPANGKSKDRSVIEKMGRRISPYFGFPEAYAPGGIRNNYGYIINDGFKGESYPYVPAANSDEFIVGIFGGSVACSFYRHAATELTENLSNHPDLADRTVTVLNYTMSGSKQPETMIMLAFFTSIGQKFDMVVNIDGLNDLGGCAINLHQGHDMSMPPADITNAFMALTAVPDLEVDSLKYFLRLGQYDKWLKYFDSDGLPFPGRKMLGSYIHRKRKNHVNRKPKIKTNENLINIQRIKPDNMMVMNEEDLLDRILQIRRFWFSCTENMVQICRGRGIKYVHALHPTHFLIERELGRNDKAVANSLAQYDWYKRLVGTGFPLMNQKLQFLNDIWEDAHHCNLQQVLEDSDDGMLSDNMGHFNKPVSFAMADALADFVSTKTLI